MEEVGILGAAFDPPHRGHAHVVSEMLRSGRVAQVWLVPVKAHPFSKSLSDAKHRVVMVELMKADLLSQGFSDSQVQINTYEIEQTGVSYSLKTLEHFGKLYPDKHFNWIIGSDNLTHFPKWYDYQKLLAQYPVLVYPRPGYPIVGLLPGMELQEQVSPWPASSTEARAQLALKTANETAIDQLVLPSVAQYSKLHHLYDTSTP